MMMPARSTDPVRLYGWQGLAAQIVLSAVIMFASGVDWRVVVGVLASSTLSALGLEAARATAWAPQSVASATAHARQAERARARDRAAHGAAGRQPATWPDALRRRRAARVSGLPDPFDDPDARGP